MDKFVTLFSKKKDGKSEKDSASGQQQTKSPTSQINLGSQTVQPQPQPQPQQQQQPQSQTQPQTQTQTQPQTQQQQSQQQTQQQQTQSQSQQQQQQQSQSQPGQQFQMHIGKEDRPRSNSAYGILPRTRGFSEYNKISDVQAMIYKEPGVSVEPAVRFLAERGYSIIERVGIGNYAYVYRVRLQNKKDMAVKIIDLDTVSRNYKIRFMPRELQIIKKLHHKNIVKVYGIQSTQRYCFIFMEFLPNGTLGDFIRKNGPLSEIIARALFSQLIEAIHYMHALGIAHRDLKLENILLDKFQNPKVADFSYSLVIIRDPATGSPTASNTFCGSLPYMSPEILQKFPYDPKAADVWSLGICLYIVLNDRVPFKFVDIAAMLQKQINRQWEFRAKLKEILSEELKDLLGKMLDPDQKARITTIGIMLHPWFTKCSPPSASVPINMLSPTQPGVNEDKSKSRQNDRD